MLERIVAEQALVSEDLYERLFAAIDGVDEGPVAEADEREALIKLLRCLMRLRLTNPPGFDEVALKELLPELTEAERNAVVAGIQEAMALPTKPKRNAALRRLCEHWPQLRPFLPGGPGPQSRKNESSKAKPAGSPPPQ